MKCRELECKLKYFTLNKSKCVYKSRKYTILNVGTQR